MHNLPLAEVDYFLYAYAKSKLEMFSGICGICNGMCGVMDSHLFVMKRVDFMSIVFLDLYDVQFLCSYTIWSSSFGAVTNERRNGSGNFKMTSRHFSGFILLSIHRIRT